MFGFGCPGKSRDLVVGLGFEFTQRRGSRVRYRRWFGYLAAILLLAVACGGDTPTAGPVTIETDIADLSASPISGTFEVTVGADVLGCFSGTLAVMESEKFGWFDTVMTCESGPKTGTFTITDGGPQFDWSVLESSDDFAGLQGVGRMTFVLPSPTTAEETYTGDIEYTS